MDVVCCMLAGDCQLLFVVWWCCVLAVACVLCVVCYIVYAVGSVLVVVCHCIECDVCCCVLTCDMCCLSVVADVCVALCMSIAVLCAVYIV